MSGSAMKRRRLDDATHTLSKPFKSPLKRNAGFLPQDGAASSSGNALPVDVRSQPPPTSKYYGNDHCTDVLPLRPDLSPSLPTTGLLSKLKAAPADSTEDAQAIALRRQNGALDRQIQDARSCIDTLTQATKIKQSNRDVELERLITVWAGVSRAAAEELFAEVKDRVNRMGGVGAWKDLERRKSERWKEWDVEPEVAVGSRDEDDGDGVDDAESGSRQRNTRVEQIENRDCDVSEYDEKVRTDETSKLEVHESNGDDSFTLDMMLRSLNIELSVIGYDAEQQTWID